MSGQQSLGSHKKVYYSQMPIEPQRKSMPDILEEKGQYLTGAQIRSNEYLDRLEDHVLRAQVNGEHIDEVVVALKKLKKKDPFRM